MDYLSPENDLQLFQKLREDDTKALSLLIDRYWPELCATACKVLPSDEGEDLAQQVFINLWENRHKLTLIHVKGFLHQDLKYRILNTLRKRKVQQEHLAMMENLQFVNKTELIISEKELQGEINGILDRLPNRTREIFVLSRFEQLSNKEIAAKLNLSIRTVEKQISNAISNFKKLKENNC